MRPAWKMAVLRAFLVRILAFIVLGRSSYYIFLSLKVNISHTSRRESQNIRNAFGAKNFARASLLLRTPVYWLSTRCLHSDYYVSTECPLYIFRLSSYNALGKQ